jgi:SHS2 domain-containing protein
VSFRFLNHPGEVELAVDAAGESEIYAEALRAFAELVGLDTGGHPGERHIRLEAPDRVSLLVDWLNELVYLADIDGFVPDEIETMSLEETRLDALVSGRLDAAPSSLVKAGTFSGAAFERGANGWRARIVLDV